MDRWACVNIPAMPLQVTLVTHPEWAAHPVAVISRDAPNGDVLWVNEQAIRSGIRTGQRYAAALELEPALRADVVPPATLARRVRSLAKCLRDFSPDVEASHEMPGVFWLNASGLTGVYRSLPKWGQRIVSSMDRAGYRATVVAGFTRFGTYAVSTVRKGVSVFHEPEEERRAVHEITLRNVSLDSGLIETLEMLGIRTIGEFIALPADGLRRRFGDEAYALHRWASGDMWDPIRPERWEPLLYDRIEFERPETDATRLLAAMAVSLGPLIARIAARGDAVQEVRWVMLLDIRERLAEAVKPAVPSVDERQILDLIGLRLESLKLRSGADELLLIVRGVPAQSGQGTLFAANEKRDTAAADRALARLRAEFGDNAVVRAHLEDRYLPEARYRWEPVHRMTLPRVHTSPCASLVRRVYAKPLPLKRAHTVRRIAGPYVVSGGWWHASHDADAETHREYYFVRTAEGAILWVYYDRGKERWFVQGEVS